MSFFRRFMRGGSKTESERSTKDEASAAEPTSEATPTPGTVETPENLKVPEVVETGVVKESPLSDPGGSPSGLGPDDLPEGAGSSLLDDLPPDSGGLSEFEDQRGWASATSNPDAAGGPLPTSPPASTPPATHTHTPGEGLEDFPGSSPPGSPEDQPEAPVSQNPGGVDYPDSPEGVDLPDGATQLRAGEVITPDDDEDDDEKGERESQSTTTPAPDDGTGSGPPLVDPGGNVIDPNIHGGDTTPGPAADEGEATEVDPSTLPGFGDTDPDPDSDDGEATVIDPSTLPGFGHTDPDEDDPEDEPDIDDLDPEGGDLL